MPKFMVFIPGNADSEAGIMPPTDLFEVMSAYNEQLAKAGVLLAAEGLTPTSAGAKVRFDDAERRTVVDGPFTEAKEIVAGYWLLQASSLEEALEWVKRAPFAGGLTLEVRPIASMDDLGPEFTPELREAEQQLRQQLGE
ncbi:YCII-related protein [Catenulispora acidiphila DSM 44928]|uniref:YCII-related protein n=1 Tax=Catenulispora acidiphila (strain DSM 44928 / JCM 14897 / NBRC 102108 / NRRL B-24433 / ID139908) TaxID=479433 RepID=C7QKF9_CATAD|nr:YciI family protein [Catenulispora acidiphila]ACU77058.1 YCII-related protein [Catenulispora acidiphila DSM 44928]